MFPSILYREIQIIPIPIIHKRDSVFHLYRILEFPIYWRIRVMLLMFSFDAYVNIVDADSLVYFSYKRFQDNIDWIFMWIFIPFCPNIHAGLDKMLFVRVFLVHAVSLPSVVLDFLLYWRIPFILYIQDIPITDRIDWNSFYIGEFGLLLDFLLYRRIYYRYWITQRVPSVQRLRLALFLLYIGESFSLYIE